MLTAMAPSQSAAVRVWNIGELQSQIIQCVADEEETISLKDKIHDRRYPFKSASSLILVSRSTANQYSGALFKSLLNSKTTLNFTVTDLEFERISTFLLRLPPATLDTLSRQTEKHKGLQGSPKSRLSSDSPSASWIPSL